MFIALGSCKLGPGKMPNPQWEPTLSKTQLMSLPVTLTISGIEITLTHATWIEETSYVLTRIPDRREYSLELTGTSPADDYQRLGQMLLELEIRTLDANGQELRVESAAALHFRGPKSAAGTFELKGHYDFSNDARRPATLVVGTTRIPLSR